MGSFFRKLAWIFQRRRKDAELREELQFHIDEEAEELRGEGVPAVEADYAARRDLGRITLVEENTRAAWSWAFLEQLLQDLRYAGRTMLRSKAFTLLVVLSLGLGMGANAAIFSFMDALFFRTLPVSDAKSLVVLEWYSRPYKPSGNEHVLHSVSGRDWEDPKLGVVTGIFPYPAVELLKKDSESVFAAIFEYHPATGINIVSRGNAERTNGEYVSGEYFSGLAIEPAAGRAILPSDDQIGAPPVVVLSYPFAKRRFGDAASAVGQTILINNNPFVVAGVISADFSGVDPAVSPDFYLPLHSNILVEGDPSSGPPQDYVDPNYYWVEMMARLRPGVTLREAEAVLAPKFHNWVATTATNDRERANLPVLWLVDGRGGVGTLRVDYAKPLFLLLAMVIVILAIACTNIANLLLARATSRRREIGVRLSMGAGRWRVVRQLLTESVLLSFLGGVFGVVVAYWAMRSLTLLLANGDGRFPLHAELNWHVLAATFALSLLTGIFFGLAPALQATHTDVMPSLKEAHGRVEGSSLFRRTNLGTLFVVAEIVMSLFLVTGAGLFVRTLSNLHSVPLGFNPENVLLFELNAAQAGHKYPEIAVFYDGLQRRFSEISGVRNATLSHSSLIAAGSAIPIRVSGVWAKGSRILFAGPEFLTAMKVRLLAGRDIDARDRTGAPYVVVVSDQFGKTFFAGKNPLGGTVTLGYGTNQREAKIVGIAANVQYGGLKFKVPPVVYIPYAQNSDAQQMVFALRTQCNPLALVNTVREIVHQTDPRVPVTNVRTQVAEVEQNINQEVVLARLGAVFAILALAIASIGVYGVMVYRVERRTGEIGIRMALGARRTSVIWMVLREVVLLATAGLLIGGPAAAAASKLVESFLFGMKPNDPQTLATAVVILTTAALLAGFVPALRASRVDPAIALRHE